MKTKMLFGTIVAAMLSTAVGYAQKVERATVDGYPVINCVGMLPAAYTSTSKGKTQAELSTEVANNTVYVRFAVANSDNRFESSSWEPAFTVCSGISGGQWRLPTQRELMLIWVLKGELGKRTSEFTPLSGAYWSATQNDTKFSWSENFDTGMADYNDKIDNLSVRCIRELEP